MRISLHNFPNSSSMSVWKNLGELGSELRKQVADGAKEFAQVAIDGVRDLKVANKHVAKRCLLT